MARQGRGSGRGAGRSGRREGREREGVRGSTRHLRAAPHAARE